MLLISEIFYIIYESVSVESLNVIALVLEFDITYIL